jgi:hypothetical protein
MGARDVPLSAESRTGSCPKQRSPGRTDRLQGISYAGTCWIVPSSEKIFEAESGISSPWLIAGMNFEPDQRKRINPCVAQPNETSTEALSHFRLRCSPGIYVEHSAH